MSIPERCLSYIRAGLGSEVDVANFTLNAKPKDSGSFGMLRVWDVSRKEGLRFPELHNVAAGHCIHNVECRRLGSPKPASVYKLSVRSLLGNLLNILDCILSGT